MCYHGAFFSERRKNQLELLLQMSFVLSGVAHNTTLSEFINRKKVMQFVTKVRIAKPVSTFRKFFKHQKPTHCFVENTSHGYQNERPSPFWKHFSANHNQLCQNRQKLLHFWHNRVDSPLVDTVKHNISSSSISYAISEQ